MTSRSLLNLALFAAVVALALFVYFKSRPQHLEEYKISSLMAEVVQSIRLERQDISIALKKLDGRWRLTEPLQARADEVKIGQILGVLSAVSNRRFPLTDLDRFGLEKPNIRLRVDHESFSFGDLAPVTSEQYVATGESIYLVAPRYAATLVLQPAALLSPRLLAEEEEISVGFELENISVQQHNGNWRVSPEKPGQKLTQNEINHWVQAWQLAYAAGCALHQGEPVAGKKEIRIALQDGKSVRLIILQQEPELVLLRVDEGIRYRFPGEIGRQLLDPYSAVRS